jgi:hypothetical protein
MTQQDISQLAASPVELEILTLLSVRGRNLDDVYPFSGSS